ncbi:glycosyltransferase family 29 (sialyltransferase) family protein [Artemisia annua]|uniref:Glycosyltransferase family 29 (Sialyltransferase) family protein n=1 Tax=Artemisia annua TaxID=35608 RepID=A0A2U1LBH4_ARTAN|nr:glycosyltransferase family 29 (sialyltransferase) family protein [Artemisia annua]
MTRIFRPSPGYIRPRTGYSGHDPDISGSWPDISGSWPEYPGLGWIYPGHCRNIQVLAGYIRVIAGISGSWPDIAGASIFRICSSNVSVLLRCADLAKGVDWMYFVAFAVVAVGLVVYSAEEDRTGVWKLQENAYSFFYLPTPTKDEENPPNFNLLPLKTMTSSPAIRTFRSSQLTVDQTTHHKKPIMKPSIKPLFTLFFVFFATFTFRQLFTGPIIWVTGNSVLEDTHLVNDGFMKFAEVDLSEVSLRQNVEQLVGGDFRTAKRSFLSAGRVGRNVRRNGFLDLRSPEFSKLNTEWLRSDSLRTSVGLDFDLDALDWRMENNVNKVGADIITMKGGIFVMDLYGGTSSECELKMQRKFPNFTVVVTGNQGLYGRSGISAKCPTVRISKVWKDLGRLEISRMRKLQVFSNKIHGMLTLLVFPSHFSPSILF